MSIKTVFLPLLAPALIVLRLKNVKKKLKSVKKLLALILPLKVKTKSSFKLWKRTRVSNDPARRENGSPKTRIARSFISRRRETG